MIIHYFPVASVRYITGGLFGSVFIGEHRFFFSVTLHAIFYLIFQLMNAVSLHSDLSSLLPSCLRYTI